MKIYDTVINKTPLSYRTNRIIGGVAPSTYVAKLEQGKQTKDGRTEYPPLNPATLDGYLISHGISPSHLRADDFEGFMVERRKALLGLISAATGHAISDVADEPDEGEELSEDLARDSETLTATE